MDIRDRAAFLNIEGHAHMTLDALRRGTLASHDRGRWTLVHRSGVRRVSFRSRKTKIRFGLSKKPVIAPDGSIVLDTTFPHD